MIDQAGLDFLNHLSGKLEVKLSEPAKPVSEKLSNLVAPRTAHLSSVSLRMRVFENRRAFRDLSEEEWSRVVLRAPSVKLANVRVPDHPVEHSAPDSAVFTVRDLARAIENTELEVRGESEWLGGIDVHHVFFEGIELEGDAWIVRWGS